jgi:hypothetical protein
VPMLSKTQKIDSDFDKEVKKISGNIKEDEK